MIDFPGLYAELEAFVAATWTDVTEAEAHYIREADQVADIPFEAMIEQHLPFAVIVFPSPQPVTLGVADRSYLLTCEFWYVARATLGSSALWAKAETMAAALWAEGRDNTPALITLGQVWSDPMPRPAWGVSQPVNRFLREKKLDILAAGAFATLVVGETP